VTQQPTPSVVSRPPPRDVPAVLSDPPRPHDARALAREAQELAERPSLLRRAPLLPLDGLARVVDVLALGAGGLALALQARAPTPTWLQAALAVSVLAVLLELGSRLALRPLRLRARGDSRDTLALAVGALGLALAAQLSGGHHSPLLALLLCVPAFAGAALPATATAAVATESGLLLAALPLLADLALWPLAAGLGATALAFGALSALILRGAVLRQRDRAAADAELRLQRLLDDARAYRLTGARAADADDAERKRAIAAVQAVRESLHQVLELAQRALRPHATLLFWLDDSGRSLQLRSWRGEAEALAQQPLEARRGVLGSVVTRATAVNLRGLKPGYEGITYYGAPVHPRCFLGVPVLEGEHLRGVLAVDRLEDEPFGPGDEGLLTTLAREVVRAAEVERLFDVMDRDRRSQEALLRLAEQLNTALTLDAALDALVGGVLEVSACELAAVVLQDDEGLQIVRARGDAAPAALEGHRLDDEGSLVASAVHTQASLPARGELAGKGRSRLFGGTLDPDGLVRGKVLPLLHQSECVGALVLASRARDALDDDTLRLLHVAAGYGAIALINGRLYARMERMATRDGLTGLVNHRSFQEQLEQALARSSRIGKPLTLLLCDIDHFKQVNDTHGHPIGDEVLRRVAKVLQRESRQTDLVARYGGEEFSVVMEATDAAGGLQVAERIRLAVAAEVVATPSGPLRVTLSGGLATFAVDASDRAALIKAADETLYQAKHQGRNRCLSRARTGARAAAAPQGA
jgi:diguanylate cyclase (GGDEF)-like protein